MRVCNWCESTIKTKQHIQVQVMDLIKADEKTGEVSGRWTTYAMHEEDCLENFIRILKQFAENLKPNGYLPEYVYVQYRKRNMLAKGHWNGTLKEYALKPENWKKVKELIKEFEVEELERIIKSTRIEPEEFDVKRLKQEVVKEEVG